MNLKKLTDRARQQAEQAVAQRGGQAGLKRDADQLKNALKGPGTMKDKARRAAEVAKRPGGTPPTH